MHRPGPKAPSRPQRPPRRPRWTGCAGSQSARPQASTAPALSSIRGMVSAWQDSSVARAFTLGGLAGVPASSRPDLLGDQTRSALTTAGLLDEVGVAEIDPALSDTAATQVEFGLQPDTLANCVVVGGKR